MQHQEQKDQTDGGRDSNLQALACRLHLFILSRELDRIASGQADCVGNHLSGFADIAAHVSVRDVDKYPTRQPRIL